MSYAVDLRTLYFYVKLSEMSYNPPYILFKCFGIDERIALESKYGIAGGHGFRDYNKLIRKSFKDYLTTMDTSIS